MRDSQRAKVYGAEGVLRQIYDWAADTGYSVSIAGVPMTLPPEARFASVASVQAYCDRVCALIGARPVSVRERRGAAKAHYMAGEIAVPVHGDRWAMRELVVLHELAHHVAPGERHGPVFVATFIDLLSAVMGPQAGLALRLVCVDAGVREGCLSPA